MAPVALAAFVPGHSGGSAPDSHRTSHTQGLEIKFISTKGRKASAKGGISIGAGKRKFYTMPMKVHLIYKRIPNRITERDDEIVADLGNIIVAKAKIEGMKNPLYINGIKVIENGYTMLYFAFVGENWDILKIYSNEGKFKGLYIDILSYTKRYSNTLEMLDLFLDIYISPDGKVSLLDEEEIKTALNSGIIDEKTFDFAYLTAREIIERIANGEFPPQIIYKYSLD